MWFGSALSPGPDASARLDCVLAAPLAAAERRQEEQDQRNQQHVDDQGLDEDEAQDQRAADDAGRGGVARDRLGGGGNRLALAQRAERRGNSQREPRADDRPVDDLEAGGAGAAIVCRGRER